MNESFASVNIKPPDLKPAISPSVHFSLTVVYTALYSILFLIVYVQLWMILYFKHRRLSYQSVFLYLCLIWAALRTTLFTFYFRNTLLANSLPTFFYWLLYCFPVCLQFITLCLLVVFFSQVVLRSWPRQERTQYRRSIWVAVGIAIFFFLATNISCAIIEQRHKYDSSDFPVIVSIVRVVITCTLFIIAAVGLCIAIIKMSKISSTSVVLEARGTTKIQALIASVLIILLYTSRALYNIIAVIGRGQVVSFGYGWINVSDQADFLDEDSRGYAYVSFGIVLFVWELLPTFVVVMFFRVQKPRTSPDGDRLASTVQQGFFFDNPRRYDSDEDLARSPTEGFRENNPAVSQPAPENQLRSPHSMTPNQEPQFYDGT